MSQWTKRSNASEYKKEKEEKMYAYDLMLSTNNEIIIICEFSLRLSPPLASNTCGTSNRHTPILYFLKRRSLKFSNCYFVCLCSLCVREPIIRLGQHLSSSSLSICLHHFNFLLSMVSSISITVLDKYINIPMRLFIFEFLILSVLIN